MHPNKTSEHTVLFYGSIDNMGMQIDDLKKVRNFPNDIIFMSIKTTYSFHNSVFFKCTLKIKFCKGGGLIFIRRAYESYFLCKFVSI